jgi:AbiV family abortive infection protein
MGRDEWADIRDRLGLQSVKDAWDVALKVLKRRRRLSTLRAAKSLLGATLPADISWKFVAASGAELAKDSLTAIQYESLRLLVGGQVDAVEPLISPSLDDLVAFMDVVLQNARDLLEESALLLDNGRTARSYALAHVAAEELAKYFFVMTASFEVATGAALDWRGLMRQASKHPIKLQALLATDLIAQNQDRLSFGFLASLLLHRDELLVMTSLEPALASLRNRSLYADFDVGERLPQRAITQSAARWMIEVASRHLRLAERYRGSAIARGGMSRWWFRVLRLALYRAVGVTGNEPMAEVPRHARRAREQKRSHAS